MPISLSSLSSSGGGVWNAGEVFTTTESWTAPADVTSVYVTVRGGDGTSANLNGNPGRSYGVSNGTDGGDSSAFGITASGGTKGQNVASGYVDSNVVAWGQGYSAAEGGLKTFIASVVPGNSYTMTVGSGPNSYISIMYVEG